MNMLDQLKKFTTVVADTGDFHSIETFTPRDATTNPSLILAAAKLPLYEDVVMAALAEARRQDPNATDTDTIAAAIDLLAVEFGSKILAIIPGRVSTEVDARLSYDTEKTIEKGRHLISLYEAKGIKRERILIKIASTWEGIEAAKVLEKEGIHCNLTLLFGLHQAIAAADAGVQLISPFVGRILDWYRAKTGKEYTADDDPGVESVTQIFNYYKKFGYKTEVMGASFRNTGEIIALAGCDLLTIAPSLLAELQEMEGTLELRLSADGAKTATLEKIEMTRETFDRMHAENEMATEKLAEGIKKFSAAQVELEEYLLSKLKG